MYRIHIPGYALIAYGVNRLRRYDYMKSLIQCAANEKANYSTLYFVHFIGK